MLAGKWGKDRNRLNLAVGAIAHCLICLLLLPQQDGYKPAALPTSAMNNLLFFKGVLIFLSTNFNMSSCVSFSGAVRLAGGSSGNNGRVEVYLNGQWGAICDTHWTDRDASVICGQLGLG